MGAQVKGSPENSARVREGAGGRYNSRIANAASCTIPPMFGTGPAMGARARSDTVLPTGLIRHNRQECLFHASGLEGAFDANRPERRVIDALTKLGMFGRARTVNLGGLGRISDIAKIHKHPDALPKIVFTEDVDIKAL